MEYFPFFFDINDRRALIVGGGDVAQRKAELLARAGARPYVVAPVIMPALAATVTAAGGVMRCGGYEAADISDCVVVVAATDDEALNRQVCADARARRTPVNVVDNPALCDFIFPAIIDRSPLVAAVSSSGASPVLARRVRARLEENLPAAMGRLAAFCRRFRDTVKSALPAAQRRMFWEKILDGAMAEAVLSGNEGRGETLLREALTRCADDAAVGAVYLIGAGPGDPELLTFRAHRLLQQADVVVYDRLVSAAVLDLARRDAKKIFVGKQRGHWAATQENINALLIYHARRGLQVARLKGGDPFIFGRGGEELLALRAAGIVVEVAAGITAAGGCAAAAGIPLTHRQLACGVRFITVYQRDVDDDAHWRRLAEDNKCTLVFYMGGAMLESVATNLVRGGRAATTPAAVICAGATPAQRVITGTLNNIAARAIPLLVSPALIIVGDVVALCETVAADDFAEYFSPFPSMNINDRSNYAVIGTPAHG